MADQGKKDESGASDGFGTRGSEDSDFGALTGGDSGLGNLPPLSDFESSAGGSSGGFDSGLPPLSAIDPSSDKDRISIGGLPPISDIPVETPLPTGGAIKPPPVGYGSTPVFGTPSSDSGIDTPSGSGFQDLSADSDFTPETPEVAPPGPESDIDTPLFDSAFGGGSAAFSAADTSAPTQAMQTPLFTADAGGFDADAFAPSSHPSARSRGGFEGTPVPDFGPDTAAPTSMTPPPSMAGATMAGAAPAKKGIGGMIGWIAAAVLFVVGLLANPYIPGVPNPLKSQINAKDAEIAKLKQDAAARANIPAGTPISQEEITRLTQQQADLTKQVQDLTTQKTALDGEVQTAAAQRDAVAAELEQKNADFVKAQADFDSLQNQTAVMQARRDGLSAETGRLESLVGKLEDADTRRMMTKETLESNISRLMVTIQEGSPLTPDKYARADRIARVQALKEKASGANWVDPALLDEYTSLYLAELEISQSREYFFAKLPVVDRFGTKSTSWAECVMNGNHGVYYRTLDGQHVGVYQNTATEGPAKYEFFDMKPDSDSARLLQSQIFAARTPGFEEKIEMLAQRQLVVDDKSDLQKKFDSL